ncbi:hypothetical protein C1X35_10395 [Pseudomonas sp. FW306-1C-G01A]|nr:hypothetical protein C1X56_14965 [Pseudomonas sp. GW101-1A09]PMV95522.1 hypothetical protein C1X55_21200 [Pseudomonas sp. GW460-C8]PMV97483.1 hypothetical protein C1X51_04455 [Pseudomonas sp. FW306-2-2C-B10A]PMW04834.1 hypothetical protein C1X50_15265 [Pseudomonas sp. MPR-TSA4]PMW13078.1 hypothetical protein C1X52_17835 [Pseudomonas sp. FW306-2-1A-C05A]PMW18117.1 hypothetical protein C1X40_15330 [Pseudomonas sp. GW456-11-11-14-TSB2]PMW18847.1 hypothetical protein C1X53_20380 [Pseudomonas s
MACSGCAARREWIKKWSDIAYERAAQLLGKPADPGADRAEAADSDPQQDGRAAAAPDSGAGR